MVRRKTALLKRRTLIALLVLASLICALAVYLCRYCPPEGIAFTNESRISHRLKNRTTLPKAADFDGRVTLETMVEAGEDSSRWSSSEAARIEGYVVSVGLAKVELANCYCSRDIHINLASRPDAPPKEQLVVEVTPRLRARARQQGQDWSEETLKRELVGRWCSFEGWLFFDEHHREDSENFAPGKAENWRATAWEIHPVTAFKIIR